MRPQSRPIPYRELLPERTSHIFFAHQYMFLWLPITGYVLYRKLLCARTAAVSGNCWRFTPHDSLILFYPFHFPLRHYNTLSRIPAGPAGHSLCFGVASSQRLCWHGLCPGRGRCFFSSSFFRISSSRSAYQICRGLCMYLQPFSGCNMLYLGCMNWRVKA